jgi:hypothetical protein
MFDNIGIQDPILEIVHTSAEEFQSRQLPWVCFPNPPLLCLFLWARPSPFLSFPWWRWWTRLMVLMWTSHSGSSWSFSWIQTTQLEAPSTPDSWLSSRMDAQRIESSGWWPSVRLITWCPWRNLLIRSWCFGLCWKVKPHLILNITYMKRVELKNSEVLDDELIELVLRDAS